MAVETLSISLQSGWYTLLDHDNSAGTIAATILKQSAQLGALTLSGRVIALPAKTVLLTIAPVRTDGFVGRTVIATNAALVGVTMLGVSPPYALEAMIGYTSS